MLVFVALHLSFGEYIIFLYSLLDIIEDLYSPRTAAMDFVSELVRKRGKENLQKFILFIVEIFNRYTVCLVDVILYSLNCKMT